NPPFPRHDLPEITSPTTSLSLFLLVRTPARKPPLYLHHPPPPTPNPSPPGEGFGTGAAVYGGVDMRGGPDAGTTAPVDPCDREPSEGARRVRHAGPIRQHDHDGGGHVLAVPTCNDDAPGR
ncbi:similar to U2 small nuclear ribonucleoprotein A, partial, partial [Chondrus crispus]